MKLLITLFLIVGICCSCTGQTDQLRFKVYTLAQLQKLAEKDAVLKYTLAKTMNVPDSVATVVGNYFWSGLNPRDPISMEHFYGRSATLVQLRSLLNSWLGLQRYKTVKLYSQHAELVAGVADVEPDVERMGYGGYICELLRWTPAKARYGDFVPDTYAQYRGYRADKKGKLLVVPVFYESMYLCDLVLIW